MTYAARCAVAIVAVLLVSALPLAASGAEEEGAMGAQANMALTKVEGEPYVDHIHASPEAYAAATGNTIERYFEAPMLAALVAEGKLPPVEERIGQDPMVVRPAFEIGQYGGVLQDAGPEFESGQIIEESQQPMAKWPPDASIFYPNIPKSWELSADEKVFTLHLRRGMKWSDGDDFDAEDFEFFYESILKNEAITAIVPEPRERYRPGGELMTMRVIDRHTIEYTFAVPFFNATRGGWARGRAFAPAHYLGQYHIDHNPDAASLAKEEGYETWMEAFAAHHSDRGHTGSLPVAYRFTDLPVTDIFVLKEDNPGVQYWERNPYYWKIDTAGNQLPYADGVQQLKLENPAQVIPGKVMAGELDWPGFWMMDPAELAVYRRNEDSGGYQAHLWTNESTSTTLAIAFNYTHKDPVKRAIFNDLRFRQAMSLAIKRQEMSDKLFLGQVEPFIPSVPRHWTGFEDWMATHYAEYDVERANELLDEMGLEWDADRKWRLQPDGEPIFIDGTHLHSSQTLIDAIDLISTYWEAVGVRMEPKRVQYPLWFELGQANELDSAFDRTGGGAEVTAQSAYPLRLIPPWHWIHCCPVAAYPWGQWYHSGGTEGEEPPDEIKRLFEITDQWLAARPGTPEYEAASNELLTLNVRGMYLFGTVSNPPVVVAVNNRIGNVPEKSYFLLSAAEPFNMDTLYIKQ